MQKSMSALCFMEIVRLPSHVRLRLYQSVCKG